jgi:ElaB/YqjD/DUF883 family membrane-anchored ribosome-binding protein
MADDVTTKAQFQERLSEAKGRLADVGQAAAGTISKARSAAAEGLGQAASTIRETAGNLGSEKASEFVRESADQVNAAARYVRDRDLPDIVDDFWALVKKNPGPSLLIAGVVGFLVGRTLTRD